jgi:uncharacterized protein YciW
MEWIDIQVPTEIKNMDNWIVHFDEYLQLGGAGQELLSLPLEVKKFTYILQLQYPASNNIAEYEALLLSMRMSIALANTRLTYPLWFRLTMNDCQRG